MDAMLGEDMDEWLWPESCPELREMETALRCLICGDFFHGPVLLPCTHTFCSECVRRFLQSRGNNGCCPECKQACAPSELVPNRTLEKIGVLFRQMKPKLLPVLEKAKVPDKGVKAAVAQGDKVNGDGKPPERMTLLSYNVMKDKDIKKLLESIGIRAPVKSRDDIIQIHKEYVLLANAQADSSHPKSAKQVREEVMRNYRARQAEKQSNGSARKSLDAAQPPVVTAEMQAGFERLRQQVKARNGQQKAKQEEEDDNGKCASNDIDDNDESDDEDGGGGGIWRHVHVVKSGLDFYIHSTTQEIRTEPPREFLERQERIKDRREHAAAAAAAAKEDDQSDDDDEPVVLGTRSVPTSQTEVTEIASADDDDDFEMLATSPPPKPLLGSRNSTPQSQTSSARKKTERRRSSVGSASSATSVTAAFFSQETSCSIQETSTQLAPSASLSLPSQMSSNGSARSEGDLSASTQGNSAGSQALTDTKWVCPRCTLVNESVGAVAECEACGYQHRPARKKQKLQFQSKLFQP